MVRYLEASIRWWWLWLLTLLATVGVGAGMYLLSAPQYDAKATIWVDRAIYLNIPNENTWKTPAQTQHELLQQLLGTRSFVMRVASATELQPYTLSEEGRVFLEEYFQKRLWVYTRGSQLLEVNFRTSQPALGVSVLDALIKVYSDEVTLTTREQARIALDFYAGQLPQREQEFLVSSQAVREHIIANGNPLIGVGRDESGQGLLEQSQFAELQRRQDLARKRYEDTLASLERVQLQASAHETAQERGFRVIDSPAASNEPTRARRELLIPVALAGAIGAALALGVPLLSVVLDPSLHHRGEVQSRLNFPVLGSIPNFHLRRRTRGAAPSPRLA